MHRPSRRQFLIRSAGLGAAFAASGLSSNLWANPLGKPIGIQLWTVNDALQRDPAGTLNKLAKIGFKEVEPAVFAGLTPQQFRGLLDAAGLHCPSTHLQFDMANLDKAFEDAHVLGAGYAVAGSLIGSVVEATKIKIEWQLGMSADEAKRTAEVANRIGEAAKRAGLQFALHNHAREFVDLGNGEVGYDIVFRETDPALVQFEFDCGWAVFAGQNPINFFKKYPGRIPLIHVKDFQPKKDRAAKPMAETMLGSELGRGTVDYKPILAAAKRAGIKHYFAEQEGPFSRMSSLEAARVNYDYLRSLN